MTKQQNGVAIAAAIILVLALGWAAWNQARTQPVSPMTPATVTVPESGTSGDAAATGAPVTILEPASHAGTTYTQALNTYSAETGSGYRFQFVNCNGTPGSLAIKKGVTFMIDNRDKDAHTFVVGSLTYKVGAEGFAIATAKDVGTYNITCDGGGAAQVIVQP